MLIWEFPRVYNLCSAKYLSQILANRLLLLLHQLFRRYRSILSKVAQVTLCSFASRISGALVGRLRPLRHGASESQFMGAFRSRRFVWLRSGVRSCHDRFFRGYRSPSTLFIKSTALPTRLTCVSVAFKRSTKC